MLLFIMYGPFGVSVLNLELSSGLTVDTRGIEEIAGNKTLNTESIRSSKARENDNMRLNFFLLKVQLCDTLLITSLYFLYQEKVSHLLEYRKYIQRLSS
jgi:hypothetical protein